MSTSELRRTIQHLNRLDVDQVEFHEIESLLRAASKGVLAPLYRGASTELYFRARVHNGEPFTKLSDFGAPPPELVRGFQRCNPPGVPMFYVASKRINAILECDSQPGDIVYLGQWLCKEPPPVNTALSTLAHPISSQATALDEMFYTYIDTIFTRPIHETFSNQYKLTAAAAHVLTTRFMPHEANDVRADGTVGLRYSSVVNISSGYNTAFHTNFAKERLELFHVMKLRILSRSGKQLRIEVLDNALEHLDGKVLWLGQPHAIPKLRVSPTQLEFISNGRVWTLPVRTEPASEQEIETLLHE